MKNAKRINAKASKLDATRPLPKVGDVLPILPPERDPSTLQIRQRQGEPQSTAVARDLIKPSINAATTIREFTGQHKGMLDLMALADELADQNRQAVSGDLTRAEAMLMSQAHTLDAMFRSLACRGARNMGEFLPAAETYMRLAMKAQSQCRATLETLAEIKNPLAGAYVRQANVAGGHQQVNNAPPLHSSRARESGIPPNKLLEASHGKRLDSGTAQAAGGANQAMATMEPINRAKVTGRKG